MAFWANPADTMAIYALSDQYGLHTSIITRSKLWTTVHPDYNGTEEDVLEISTIKLLYMGANRYGRIWKKAVPDQPSYYGPNFHYQPMLTSTDVPSTDDVGTACTLVQIGKTLTSYPIENNELDLPQFEGLEVTISDDAMDKVVGRLDVCSWKPLNSVDAMDQVITEIESKNVNVETNKAVKLKIVVNVETKWCTVKLVRLDSIVFDNDTNKNEPAIKETLPVLLTDTRLHPRNRISRSTRHPQNASQNVLYTEGPDVTIQADTNQRNYMKNTKPPADGPSEYHVRAQKKSL